jgi:hypothetical protein
VSVPLKDKVEVERGWGLLITWVEYVRLREEVQRIMDTFQVRMEITDERIRLEDFICKNKKGCKRFRDIKTGIFSKVYAVNSPTDILYVWR